MRTDQMECIQQPVQILFRTQASERAHDRALVWPIEGYFSCCGKPRAVDAVRNILHAARVEPPDVERNFFQCPRWHDDLASRKQQTTRQHAAEQLPVGFFAAEAVFDMDMAQ